MEKIEKLFNSCKGLILFYIIVAILTLMLARTIENINSQAINITEETYYA